MTVNISKPSINIREKLAELDKPSGIAGETVLRADSVQEIRSQIAAGRKNLIINGGMDVSQRGDFTTASQLSTGYSIDRIRGSSSMAVSTKQHKLNQSVDDTIKNTLATVITTAATGYVYQFQRIELDDMRKHHGKTLTASCWIKSNQSSFGFVTYDMNGWTKLTTNTSSGTWQKITATFVCDSLTATSYTIGISNFGSGAAHSALAVGDYFEFTELQLELGSVATEFEHRSYGEELALCQRYYYAVAFLNTGVYNTDTSVFCTVNAPSTFRVTPSVSMKSGTYTNINVEKNDSYTITNVAFSHGTTQEYFKYNPLVVLTMPTRSGYAGQAGMVSCDRNNDAFVFDAEL